MYKDLGDRGEVRLADCEESSLEGRHNVFEKHFYVRRRVGNHILDELAELTKWELPNIDLLVSESFKGLLDQNGAMSLVVKELEHIDNDFGVHTHNFVLHLLH